MVMLSMGDAVPIKEIYHGNIFNLYKHTLLSGAERDIIHHAGSVGIVPVINDEIIFIRQHREGCGTILEIPAGRTEAGEMPSETAIMELREETGYDAKKIEYLGHYFASPGYTTEKIHLFLAESLVESPLPNPDDEPVSIERIGINEVAYKIANGDFNDAKTALGALLAIQRIGLRKMIQSGDGA